MYNSAIDCNFLVIIFLCGVFSARRKFIKEVVLLLSFFLSLFLCMHFNLYIKENIFYFLNDHVKNVAIAFLIIYLSIFAEFFVKIFLYFFDVGLKIPKIIDIILSFGIGCFRGLLFVSFIVHFFNYYIDAWLFLKNYEILYKSYYIQLIDFLLNVMS
ncbi:CvpA family protein [Buchnera aphidicola]|uniref:CvpA family protein n=1 Tax=Buchnera aphidicola TaxID=9 RepID=UPI0030EBE575